MRFLLVVSVLSLAACRGSPLAKLCVFSEVTGVVTSDGRPVEGAVVERSWSWVSGEPRTDTVTTDARGRFAFPALFARSMMRSILPMEPVVQQRIMIRHGDEEYVGYDFVKRNYDENGEFGRPLDLACGLEASLDGEHFYGVCSLETPEP